MTKCIIIGGGPSLIDFPFEILTNQFTIAINKSFQHIPNCNIVYFTDANFWFGMKEQLLQSNAKLVRGCYGLPIVCDAITQYKLIHKVISLDPDKLAHGYNSPYAAINYAAIHLNFDVIYTLGIDMTYNSERNHFHDGYSYSTSCQQSYDKMISKYAELKLELDKIGKVVINVNDVNKLAFDSITYNQFIDIIQKEGE